MDDGYSLDFESLLQDPPIASPPPQRRKRTHGQMLREHARIENYYNTPAPYPTAVSSSLNHFFPPPPAPATRFPGDGFDFRRPTMTSNSEPSDIIDLTGADSPPQRSTTTRRPPRRGTQRPPPGQDVITLDDSEEEQEQQPRGRNDIEDLGDIEILRTRTIRPPTPPDPAAQGLAWHANLTRENLQRQSSWADTLGLPLLRDVMFEPFTRHGPFAHSPFLRGLARQSRATGRRPDHPVQGIRRAEVPPRFPHHHHPRPVNFQPPRDLDYGNAAFQVTRQPVQYEPPPAAKDGFTRTPDKDDVLVCPNCDGELGDGDTDVGKQIWVIRNCGHVYCGDCATRRHRSKKTQGDPAKTFTKCVVEGCSDKSVSSARAMFQVYI